MVDDILLKAVVGFKKVALVVTVVGLIRMDLLRKARCIVGRN